MNLVQHPGTDRLELSTEVVIVGSGAGGAAIAQILADAGLDVVVLEEGPYIPQTEYGRFRPTETLRKMGREAGTTPVFSLGDTPVMSVMAGRAVGGSSILTGGVCFRIPGMIHKKWVEERNLPMLSEAALAPAFDSVERISHVEEVPASMRSRSTVKFVDGATRLGIPMKPMRRNTKGCNGCGRCNFGCPHGAKLSVDLTYLPMAHRAGAQIYAQCLVERITTAGGRATGVVGRILGDRDELGRQQPVGTFWIKAQTVIVAAGSLHSPQLLLRSGFRNRAIGRHLTLHPGIRTVALFDERIEGWRGALQSVYSDHFEADGITLTGLFVPPNVLAATLPGVGRAFAQRVSTMGNVAVFGGLVHDDAGGRVHAGFGREPLLTYRMSRENKASTLKCIRILGESFLAAGAKEVYLPIFGAPPVRTHADLDQILSSGLSAKKIECITFHPLGSCRIAADPKDGAADPEGRSWELPNVYLADGSVVPSSIGVNSQLTVMAMATRIGWRLREHLRDRPVGPTALRTSNAEARGT
ncbi:MAG: GMC family oxidoreductase [Deltaproteobacteria bacterium]|nr:GMC family oxidoreductase [Deltaproteobacteria bacterium]